MLMKIGRTACWHSHAVGRRQASLGTPVPRTPTVAPGPKVRSGLASRRSEGPSSEHCGPQKPVASVDVWRLIGRGRLRFPTLPRQLLDLTKAGGGSTCLHCFFLASLQIPFLAPRHHYLQIRSSLALHLLPMAPCKVRTSSTLAWYEPALEAPTVYLQVDVTHICALHTLPSELLKNKRRRAHFILAHTSHNYTITLAANFFGHSILYSHEEKRCTHALVLSHPLAGTRRSAFF